MIFGQKPDSSAVGNHPLELDQLRKTLRANLPKQEWPAVDRIHRALIEITRGSRMTTDTEMFRVQILTTVEALRSMNKDTKAILEVFEESLSSRLRTDLRADFQQETINCFRQADVAQIRIKWWPMLLFGLITGLLGWMVGRQTQPDRDYYFMMRKIGNGTLTFKASPKPYGEILDTRNATLPEFDIREIPDQQTQEAPGLDSLEENQMQRLKNIQQRRR